MQDTLTIRHASAPLDPHRHTAMTGSRTCAECGAANLDDALFCASCGVELSQDHLVNPGLAALVSDDGSGEMARPPAEPVLTEPATSAGSTTEATPPPTDTRQPSVATPPAAVTAAAPATPPGTATPPPTEPAPVPSHVPAPAPAPRRPERPWLIPTVVVFVVLTIAAIVLVALSVGGGDDTTTPSTPSDPIATSVAVSSVPDATVAPTTDPAATTPETTLADTTVPETTAPPTTEAPVDPATALAETAAADLPRALELRERWVPQLSAKEDGTEWEGVTYDLAGILALHESLSDQVGGALLVEGSTLAFLRDGERMAGWWFTLADVEFDDPDDALDWCATEGFDRSNCAARLVTDRDDATGTLRLRPADSE